MRSFLRLTILIAGLVFFAGINALDIRNTGMASSYPSSFEGKLTASGEIYNATLYTASHEYLPFGTIVKVTNLRTNQTVEVKINDRFPFKTNRLIDISNVAAKDIELFGNVAPMVRIEVLSLPEEGS